MGGEGGEAAVSYVGGGGRQMQLRPQARALVSLQKEPTLLLGSPALLTSTSSGRPKSCARLAQSLQAGSFRGT